MSDLDKKPAGYVNAVHVFGRSMLARLGQTHHIQWQWRNNSNPLKTIMLTKEQYKHIKTLLGPVTQEIKTAITEHANSIKVFHKHTQKSYMKVKRYLKKEKLIV